MAVKFDRSKYKAKKLTELADQKKEIKAKSPSNGRADVMRIPNDGTKSILRIAPAPPIEGYNWYEIVSTAFLPFQKKDKDGNKMVKDGKPLMGQRPIFTADFHGVKAMGGKDPVGLYIDFIRNQTYADDSMDREESKTYLNPIYGWRSGKTYNGGISPSKKIMVYGWLNGIFGRIEISPSIMDKIDVLASGFDADNSALATDPWTDPDTGVSLILCFDKTQDNPSNKWQVTVNQKEVAKPAPLTDAQFEEFASQTPLTELYKDVFDESTFNLQLEGLKNFEKLSGEKLEANGFKGKKYDVFSFDEFMDAIGEIALLVPSKKDPSETEEDDTDTGGDEDDQNEETTEDTNDVIDQQSGEVEENEEEEEEPIEWTEEGIDSLGKEELDFVNESQELKLKFNSKHKVQDRRDMVKKALGFEVPEPAKKEENSGMSASALRMQKLRDKMAGK